MILNGTKLDRMLKLPTWAISCEEYIHIAGVFIHLPGCQNNYIVRYVPIFDNPTVAHVSMQSLKMNKKPVAFRTINFRIST